MEAPQTRKSIQNEFTLASISHLSSSSSPPNLSPVARFCSNSGVSELRFEQGHEPLNFNLHTSQLNDVSTAIRAKFGGIEIKTVVVDFSGDLVEGVKRIEEVIEGLEVGVLINNVGVSYHMRGFFMKWMRNCCLMWGLPGMLKRKRGGIINIGFGAAIVIPSDPLYSLYAAAKASVNTLFSQPSGISLSPDLKVAYIADSESRSIRSVDLKTGGSKLLAGGDPVFSDNLFWFGDHDGTNSYNHKVAPDIT
ncbi:very-long-chain 3-oxoacyl-CoA reductase 1-like [Apium graveolens]|uniref:very-long-chain 3-oxoacyl-CoA reductase 1-like n=1 Tax=Apium graveolens TaxID=4045 RepID=UPI003D7A20AE